MLSPGTLALPRLPGHERIISEGKALWYCVRSPIQWMNAIYRLPCGAIRCWGYYKLVYRITSGDELFQLLICYTFILVTRFLPGENPDRNLTAFYCQYRKVMNRTRYFAITCFVLSFVGSPSCRMRSLDQMQCIQLQPARGARATAEPCLRRS